jgi:uncharacterized protein
VYKKKEKEVTSMQNHPTFICVIRSTRPGFVEEMLPEEVEAMRAHSAYLDRMVKETTFHLIGPCLDRAFGVSIFEAESLEAACEMVAHDPAVERGVMSAEVHPFHISHWRQANG